MSPRVALVTTDLVAVDDPDHDLAAILAALAALGVPAAPVRWRDEPLNPGMFDLVVLRSPWDYPEHLDAFHAWMNRVAEHTPILNCPATIRWNLDKRYLIALGAADIAVVPTTFCGRQPQVAAAIAATDSPRVVIKPNVSIGSRDSGLFDRDDEAAHQLADRILASGRLVMVQPAIDRVAEVGEHALVCFDGEFSHAFAKGPILAEGGGFLGGRYTENITPATPSNAEIALVTHASGAIATLVDHTNCDASGFCERSPLYARFDVVEGEDGPLLLEAELFEPAYFLSTSPGAAERFAAAVARRVQQFGS